MLRDQLNGALKDAMRARDQVAVSTVRLISAAIKDRDIAVRPEGRTEGISDAEIVEVMRRMIRQRQESVELYEKGGRPELAEKERREIAVIERFLPRQIEGAALEETVAAAIAAVGAASIKDMGKVVAELRTRHPGQIDIARASAIAKSRLG